MSKAHAEDIKNLQHSVKLLEAKEKANDQEIDTLLGFVSQLNAELRTARNAKLETSADSQDLLAIAQAEKKGLLVDLKLLEEENRALVEEVCLNLIIV